MTMWCSETARAWGNSSLSFSISKKKVENLVAKTISAWQTDSRLERCGWMLADHRAFCCDSCKSEVRGNMFFEQSSLAGRLITRFWTFSRKRASVYSTMKSLAIVLGCLLIATLMVRAQGVGTSGDITGTVTDSSGGVLVSSTVNVVDAQTGLKRTATPNSSGQFRVAGLPPATYDVSAEMPGFATEIRKSVTVAIGQIVVSDFKLKLSKVATVIEVNDQPPVVETERGSQADRITEQYIADLPVDRRDYLTFTLLAPGVSDSSRLAGDQDFRVKQTPQSGLSFYGSNGRGNSITIDGGETSGDSGGVRLTVNQDDVQEFQINRSNYAADLGAATGASINIVTKSGTNNLQGTVYGFSATMPWTLATH